MNLAEPIIGVSLKMHLGYQQTVQWLTAFRDLVSGPDGRARGETFVLPSFPALAAAQQILGKSGVRHGAQDAFWETRGPYTGEVSAADIRELGGSYVEVGHAERRRIFGETDAVVARKTAAVAAAGLTPVVCIGEVEHTNSTSAAAACRAQLSAVLEAVPAGSRIIVAYEPVWAIGAAEPAPATHIRAIANDIRAFASRPAVDLSVIYGGSAGPGLLNELESTVDGLFLGRSALDYDRLRDLFAEVRGAAARLPAAVTTATAEQRLTE